MVKNYKNNISLGVLSRKQGAYFDLLKHKRNFKGLLGRTHDPRKVKVIGL